VSLLLFLCAWNIDTESQHLPRHHMCWHAERHPQLNCLCGYKSRVARQSGLCAELLSIMCDIMSSEQGMWLLALAGQLI